jgi:hypothetical protein
MPPSYVCLCPVHEGFIWPYEQHRDASCETTTYGAKIKLYHHSLPSKKLDESLPIVHRAFLNTGTHCGV